MQRSPNDGRQEWTVIQTFRKGMAAAEVSRAGDTGKFSFRLSWRDGERQGPWFPATGISFQEDVASVLAQSEDFILSERERLLDAQEAKLSSRKGADAARRESIKKVATQVASGNSGSKVASGNKKG